MEEFEQQRSVVEVRKGARCWLTGYAAVGIDAFVWLFLEVFGFDPAGFVGQVKFLENHQDL